MRIRALLAATLALVWLSLALFVGCSGGAQYCSTSPIDIEETRSDSRDLDTELARVRERLATAQSDLARWQTRLADRRAELPKLEAELVRLKQLSGVTEEMVAPVEPKPREDDSDEIQILPPGGVTGGRSQTD